MAKKKAEKENAVTELYDEMIKDDLGSIHQELQLLNLSMKKQVAAKDEIIAKLHDELQFYKKDSQTRFVDQIMKEIIKIRKDMISRMKEPAFASMNEADLRREYTYIFEDISDLLNHQNIDSYSSVEGTLFDPARHTARTINTDDPEKDRLVKESLSAGYTKGERVLLPEKVIVWRYDSTAM